MFWRMAGLSTASPVESILEKEKFSLDELLDEDEIIQECKALNGRLINYLRERTQVEQLLRYIVEEAPDDGDKRRTFKFPFVACEIFTCEVDIILKTLVEDEELMDLLFSFLHPDRSHSALLAGYFSKVVICLMMRKMVPFINYVEAHQGIIRLLIDLIGITSIMEILIRLIGADEHMYANYMESMKWIEEMNVIEMIVDKFSSSDSPEVHANTAEILCAITRCAPSGLAAKISSPSIVGRLFRHALEDSRPKSVLIHSLSVCMSLLDPKRTTAPYHAFRGQHIHGPSVTASPETVESMLETLGDLVRLLDASSAEVLPTTYGKLQPPLGKCRLKIVEFLSVLVHVGNDVAEKELIQQGAIQRTLQMFFEYPYNNFLHQHVENILMSCLESKNCVLIDHLLHHCDIVGKILDAERHFILATSDKPTVPAEGRKPPRIGNIGHLTRLSNKLIQLASTNSEIQTYLQENNEWFEWQNNALARRNALENVYQWTCGRPTGLHDRTRDSDEEDFREGDYDMDALADDLSKALRYGLYNNDINDEAHGSLVRDDEDVYFDDESAEVVISSLRLGDDNDSGSLFTNSNWFAFEDDQVVNDRAGSLAPKEETATGGNNSDDELPTGRIGGLVDSADSFEEHEQSPSCKEDFADAVSDSFLGEEMKEDSIIEVDRESSEIDSHPSLNRKAEHSDLCTDGEASDDDAVVCADGEAANDDAVVCTDGEAANDDAVVCAAGDAANDDAVVCAAGEAANDDAVVCAAGEAANDDAVVCADGKAANDVAVCTAGDASGEAVKDDAVVCSADEAVNDDAVVCSADEAADDINPTEHCLLSGDVAANGTKKSSDPSQIE